MICRCRNCGKKYDEDKSRADFKGYCSQACLHERAWKFGWRKSHARFRSEYDVLNRADQLGSCEWKD